MKVVPFIAESPAAALVQIHQQLGPDAVVVSVRPLPRPGLARLWQKSAVEVLACVAEPDEATSWERRTGISSFLTGAAPPHREATAGLPISKGPMADLPPLHDGTGGPHVFIGPPGSGKTTLLCKWMTYCVLNESRPAKVWRLDGASANTAEFLNIYAEMLGVTLDRFWAPLLKNDLRQPEQGELPETAESTANLLLVDVPGVSPGDTEAWHGLTSLLASLPSPRVHLVLNAAYETSILAEQFRAFARLRPEDLSFTHLDEEQRQGKLLDFIVGTNCSLRFLSTGQKIPGDLVIAGSASLARPEMAS